MMVRCCCKVSAVSQELIGWVDGYKTGPVGCDAWIWTLIVPPGISPLKLECLGSLGALN